MTIRLKRTFDDDSAEGLFHYIVFDDDAMGTTRTARADWLSERHLRRMSAVDRENVEALARHNRLEGCRYELSSWPREKLERALEEGPAAEELKRWSLDAEQWTTLARQLLE